MTAFRFIDLFAGIGGLRIGFQGIGGHCVFTAEWDKYARRTYQANFRDNHELAEDVRDYSSNPDLVPEHDVLLAGFPCQPFSIAGVSKKNALGRPHGFLCDTQGTLFFDTAKIIQHHQPAAFVLENVKNLERHDRGRTFATIMNVLQNELGYKVQARVISSHHWVPQKRERTPQSGVPIPSTSKRSARQARHRASAVQGSGFRARLLLARTYVPSLQSSKKQCLLLGRQDN